MTDAELRERCSYWQKVLRLQDWRVDACLADSVETDGQMAKCRVFSEEKLAIVRVLKPEGQDVTDQFHQAFSTKDDLEISLVHELLHIPFDKLFNDDAEEHETLMQEQATHFLAEALVGLDRREPGAEG